MKRVAHVVNQFFAGIGGEEKADVAAGTLDALAGPTRGLQRLLEGEAEVAPTIYFGDNHFHERPEEARAALLKELAAAEADLIVLGPGIQRRTLRSGLCGDRPHGRSRAGTGVRDRHA